jgi:hypothetical protein
MDETTASWITRVYGSYFPDQEKASLAKSILALKSMDDQGHYLELREIEKDHALEIAMDMAERAFMQTYQKPWVRIAKEILRYAGFDAVQRLADIVEPSATQVRGTYKTVRQKALEKIREREKAKAEAQAQAASSQDPHQGR